MQPPSGLMALLGGGVLKPMLNKQIGWFFIVLIFIQELILKQRGIIIMQHLRSKEKTYSKLDTQETPPTMGI